MATVRYFPTILNAGAPSATDDKSKGYRVGQQWYNTSDGTIYKCTDNTASAAVWASIANSSGDKYLCTSVTSNAIAASGDVTFTTQAGLALTKGVRLRAAHIADTTKYMEGIVLSYSGATLVITMDTASSSGTFTDWSINLAGGAAGGGGSIVSKDEGSTIDSVLTEINFIGAGVTAAQTATGKISVTIPGGGGAADGPIFLAENFA